MSSKPKLGVFIGRFAPYHLGHEFIVNLMREECDAQLIIVGSKDQARNLRTPFTVAERTLMLPTDVEVATVRDYPYPFKNPKWIAAIKTIVANAAKQFKNVDTEVVIYGAEKDRLTSAYLHFFPEWTLRTIKDTDGLPQLSGTIIREIMFGSTYMGTNLTDAACTLLIQAFLPKQSYDIVKILPSTAYDDLKEGYHNSIINRKMYGAGPFIATDILLRHQNTVCLIQRKTPPGAGNWAMPGGYLENDLTLADNALKELKEETAVELENPAEYLVEQRAYDFVYRSNPTRIVCHAFYFDVSRIARPLICPGDDAANAQWTELKYLANMQPYMHDDHFHIIEDLTDGFK